ncbi:MAG: dihydrodipicolinate synthase family protein [Caldilineaceae bacterium]
MGQPWRGIFVIVATPYTESYELDEASLRKEVRFCIEAGVSGLVGPAFASEFMVLADDERKRWIEIVVGEAAGRVPVVATTHAVWTVPAVALSRWAAGIGADGIMNMPPHVHHLTSAQCYDHYQAISEAVNIPVIIQNMIGPIGTPLGSELLARMCRELEQVQYIKEETLPEPRKIAQTIAVAGDACKGVFGGRGGSIMIDEFLRGAVGNMPGASTPDVHVAIWNKLEAGDIDGARALFNQALPLFNLYTQFGAGTVQQVLHRRGVFATANSRLGAANGFTDQDHKELETVLAGIEPLFMH